MALFIFADTALLDTHLVRVVILHCFGFANYTVCKYDISDLAAHRVTVGGCHGNKGYASHMSRALACIHWIGMEYKINSGTVFKHTAHACTKGTMYIIIYTLLYTLTSGSDDLYQNHCALVKHTYGICNPLHTDFAHNQCWQWH